MRTTVRLSCILIIFAIQYVTSIQYDNFTLDPASLQQLEFKMMHKTPIGLMTTSAGTPVEIRDTITLNTDIFANDLHFDMSTHTDAERIPERVVHANGAGAFGYFEVLHDVSKYTKASVFNGIGKKTPVFGRFSTAIQRPGGSELAREVKGFAIKFYTDEGNLDLVCSNFEVYFYRDPLDFTNFVHQTKVNPRTNLNDATMFWDLVTLKPDSLHAILWIMSDFGIPNGYRKMNAFPVHTFELNNIHGEKYYVKFNFRTEQGVENLTSAQAAAITAIDPKAYTRDLYNAIAKKNFPSWRLEMYVMTQYEIEHVNYNPFDVTELWRKGTYRTVPIGRLVLNRNPDNYFKNVEQSAFNPANLVPGIPGPADFLFRARRFAYRDTHKYRLGINFNRINVNKPNYAKTYNRDGVPPLRDNMLDAPNSYPNSFNGPVPYVDESRPKEKLKVYQTIAVDLASPAYFYRRFLQNDDQRQRLVNNTAISLLTATPPVLQRALRLLTLTDLELGQRVTAALTIARATAPPLSLPELGQQNMESDQIKYV